jgi:acylphosphatase
VETWLARITGRVQGVGYRESCVRQARALGLAGWVRNRSDGSVEALLQGPPERLAQMRAWLHQGPPLARVEAVHVAAVAAPAEMLARFERRPSA